VGDRELGQQLVEHGLAAVAVGLDHLQHAAHVLLDREAAEDRGLLRQVADAEPRPAIHRQVGDVVPVQGDPAIVRR
jgi:hypothetical protein